ncbi:hypothetical protein [Methylobacterium sp. Leaf100]|uniref:hypothetical protein n=1 Tax=Methylobacterium sp. Leaf100 TaxID=1736252 RepID=UPI000AC9760C|nr:hypothetical protein [Methylobacterium sp. Leaf100]
MTKTIPLALAGVLSLALAACSDEPSSSAMEQAFLGVFARMSPPEIAVTNLQLGGKPDGKVDDPTDVTNFRKTSCSPAQPKDGYVCEFSVTLNGIGRPKMKTRFFKGPDGKLAIDD